MHKKNARIERTFLGVEDHGLFTFNIDLDYGYAHQGAGNYSLGSPSRDSYAERGLALISAILTVVGVDSWEKLPGRPIVALFDTDGGGELVRGFESFPSGTSVIFADVLDA